MAFGDLSMSDKDTTKHSGVPDKDLVFKVEDIIMKSPVVHDLINGCDEDELKRFYIHIARFAQEVRDEEKAWNKRNQAHWNEKSAYMIGELEAERRTVKKISTALSEEKALGDELEEALEEIAYHRPEIKNYKEEVAKEALTTYKRKRLEQSENRKARKEGEKRE